MSQSCCKGGNFQGRRDQVEWRLQNEFRLQEDFIASILYHIRHTKGLLDNGRIFYLAKSLILAHSK